MLTKTIRQNIEIANGINEICRLNPRITRESEVIRYAYNQVATDIKLGKDVKWDDIALIDFNDKQADITFSETRTVTISNDDFEIVKNHFIDNKTGIKRIQFAYLTRLVLLYTRKKLRDLKVDVSKREVVVKSMDGVSLIRQIAELLERNTDEANQKILKIKQIIEEV